MLQHRQIAGLQRLRWRLSDGRRQPVQHLPAGNLTALRARGRQLGGDVVVCFIQSAISAALRVPGLHAAKLEAHRWEEQSVLQHGADTGEARCCGDKHPGAAANAGALLLAVGQAGLVHHVAKLVEHLKLSTNRAVHMGVHGQGHSLEPALLPLAQALEAVLTQHAAIECILLRFTLKMVLCVSKDATLLWDVGAPTPHEDAERSAREATGRTRHEGLPWGGHTSLEKHQARTHRAEVVDAHTLQGMQVGATAPTVQCLGQRAEELLDDAVQLSHERRVRASLQANLREKGKRLGLHMRQLL
mmetsp:Transcript_15848/g.37050  ORF Transcript_15848/g.37050 Transcript_15848/m.37050 type:complete len:302 (-) Transcript_15848:24-929(-)